MAQPYILNLLKSQNLYIGIGKRSKWDDESNPPAENAAATSLDDTIGYKLVTRKFAARPYEDGDDSSMVVTISSDDKYTLLADNDPTIWTAPATFLYCEVNITIEETNIIMGKVQFYKVYKTQILEDGKLKELETRILIKERDLIMRGD